MFNTEDILARLENGETVEDIAKEMTDKLNSANKVYSTQKKADTARITELRNVVTNAVNYICKYYLEDENERQELIDSVREASDTDFVKMDKELKSSTKHVLAILKATNGIKDKAFTIQKKMNKDEVKNALKDFDSIFSSTISDADDLLRDFIKKNNW